ncbi:hypothetical protein [Methylobacterium oxalidis]|uniref:Uncharacterized protein n=1 Tax=Methylobacterium oxalidis TaxID=944322 RepID=A0A512IYL9_9HYPH|nr:hypothetical protein [Methylobacterium oxalidis]GEP02807.1 hypothetical protein MOX02_08450 [Methylobacterium oxalidis]GJE33794.1 hypothetical protein LDDCCGHA_3997 [Methylobacterium oxalidis]GLS66793.1 hypothetical protein GCM10007888_51760 [Methylobacterium oxalidis]
MNGLGTRTKSARNFVLGLLAIWSFSAWQLFRAAAWGVVFYPGRHSGDRLLAVDAWDFWAAIYVWTVLGPIFMVGTATFMWIQRHDRF